MTNFQAIFIGGAILMTSDDPLWEVMEYVLVVIVLIGMIATLR